MITFPQIGDRVKLIKLDDIPPHDPTRVDVGIVDEMEKYFDTVVTVDIVQSHTFRIEEDPDGWNWAFEWIEYVVPWHSEYIEPATEDELNSMLFGE